MSRWTIVVFTSLLAMSMPASASYIGIFMDAGATTCVAQVGPTPFIDLHVVAVLSGEVPVMMGAQFQITGAPEGWSSSNVLWVPADGTVNLGHPMFASPPRKRGVMNAFSSCQGAEGEVTKVSLGRLILLGAPTPVNVHLRVQGFELVPTDPRCPFVLNCDLPGGVRERMCRRWGDRTQWGRCGRMWRRCEQEHLDHDQVLVSLIWGLASRRRWRFRTAG